LSWPATLPSFVAGPAVSTDLQELSDALAAIGGVWSTWTPTWASTGTTNPAIGNGTITARYINPGKLVLFSLAVTMGSTTTYGGADGAWTFTLPVAARAAGQRGYFGTATDVSTGTDYPIAFQVITTTVMSGRAWAVSTSAFQAIRAAQPFTWTSGDTFAITGFYEAA